MKKLFLLPLFGFLFAACSSSSGSDPSIPAVMPRVGAEFIYQVDAPQGTLREQARITSAENDSFTVVRTSDTINNFWTSGTERYVLRPSGDLFLINSEPSCDSFPLPIATHHNFSGPSGGIMTPTKENGFVDTSSSVTFQTNYEGVQSVTAAGSAFVCTQVSEGVTVTAASGYPGGVDTEIAVHRYWYTSEIGFFVRDQEISRMHGRDSVIFTRTLVSY